MKNTLPGSTISQSDEMPDARVSDDTPSQWRERLEQVAARIPLRWRVALVAFVLLAVLMGSLGMVLSLTEEHVLLANQAVALHNEEHLAFRSAGPHGGVYTGGNLGSAVQGLANANTRVTIYGADGSLLATTDNLPEVPPAISVGPSNIAQVLSTNPSSDSYLVLPDDRGHRELVVLMAVPLVVGTQQETGVLALSTPTAPIDHAVATTRLILLFGILGALAIAAAVLLPLMTAALRPLRTMEATTRRIAEGDLSLRVEEPPTDDEVGQLARSFNVMVTRLDAAFSRQKRFVADVSHELRTPLTALGGGLEMLLMGMDAGDPERGRRLLRGMYAEVERMRRLVLDLLTLARLDEGRQTLHVGRIEVAPLLSAVAEEAQQLARGQEVSLIVPEGLPAIAADPDSLRQVLLILVDNAIKFTPVPGRVALSAVAEGRHAVRIEVSDTGPGIAADVLPHVFDRFYRADPARARATGQAGGSGLGLSIAKGLTEALGGTIGITSTLGEGARAWVRFPVYASASASTSWPARGGSATTPRLGVGTLSGPVTRQQPRLAPPSDASATSGAMTTPPPAE